MSETKVQRRGFGEDGIQLDATRNRYMGAISLGYGPNGKRFGRKVSGKTNQEVRAKLQALHEELNAGVKSSGTYTLRAAVDGWLRGGLDGTSERMHALYEGMLEPLLDGIGARLLRDLRARRTHPHRRAPARWPPRRPGHIHRHSGARSFGSTHGRGGWRVLRLVLVPAAAAAFEGVGELTSPRSGQ